MLKIAAATKQSVGEFLADDCMSQAAALAFYTIFSLPPLLMMVFYVAELTPIPQHTIDQLLRTQLGVPMTGASSVDLLEESDDQATLRAVAERTGVQSGVVGKLGPVSKILGVCLLAFTATGVFAQLQYALNRIWKVEPDPAQGGVWSFMVNRLISLGMIIVIGFLLLVSLVLTTILEEILRAIQGNTPGDVAIVTGIVVNNVGAFAIAALLFTAMYLVLPDVRMHWRDVLVGAAFTSALFVLGKFLIGWYLNYANVGTNWGNAATATIGLVVWVYWSALTVLFGAEMTQVWAKRYGGGYRPVRGAVRKVEVTHRIREPQQVDTD